MYLPALKNCRCEPERKIGLRMFSQSTKAGERERFHTAATGT